MPAVGSWALAAALLVSPPEADAGEASSPSASPAEMGAAADTEAEEEIGPETDGAGLLVGQLRPAGSRDGIAGAVVARTDGAAQVETDAAGRFELWLPAGRHRLLLRADGFVERTVAVEVGDGERVELVYRLLDDLDRDRYRTVVDAELEVAVSRTRLSEAEIREVPGTGGDPFKVVTSLPGASQVAGFLPYVVVRGAAPGNTGYFLDGIRVPLLFHVAAGPSVVHPYFIDTVDFYPSGAPVRLGRFASGMVEGRTRRARSDRLRGEIDVRLTDAGALLEVPVNRPRDPECDAPRRRDCERGDARGSIAVAGRYSYTGLILSLIPQLNARIQYWDFQTRFDHDLGPRATYRAFAYGAFDLLGPRRGGGGGLGEGVEDGQDEGEDDGPPDPFLRFEFYRLDQRVIYRMRDGGEAIYKVGLGFDRAGVSDAKTQVWRIMPRAQWVWSLRPVLDLGVGIDTEVQMHRLDNQFGDISVGDAEDLALFLSEREVFLAGLWADLRWRKGPVELRPGLRADLYLQQGQSPQLTDAGSISSAVSVDPRLLARETIDDRWTLRQSIGVYHQPPDFPIPVPGIEGFGFDLGLQRNVQGTVGYELRLGEVAVLTQDAYLGRLDGLLDFELSQVEPEGGSELEDFLLRIDGWTYGLETMLKLDPRGRLFGWAAYTLSRATRDYPVGGVRPSAWDQTHIANLVLGYRIGRKWRLGGRLHFNSGRPYTPQRPGSSPFESLARDRNSRRLPAFFQFDLRVERIWTRRDWEIQLYLDVVNATLNTEILACTGGGGGEGSGGRRDRTLDGCADPQGIPYILPALGVRAAF